MPKRGDLATNWHGISLLEVVAILFAQVIQQRLQHIAKDILAESQCGFQKGRDCCDIIFMAQQLLDKAQEHQELLLTFCVDLRRLMTQCQGLPYGKFCRSWGFSTNVEDHCIIS